MVGHKQKTTTLSSTTKRSQQLNGVGKKSVYKKVWSGTMKVGWVATPIPILKRRMTHTIALKNVVTKNYHS